MGTTSSNPGWWQRRSKRAKGRLVVYPALVAIAAFSVFWMTAMPGKSYRGALPALTEEDKKLVTHLRRDVGALAGEVGERNMGRSGSLESAASKVDDELTLMGYGPKLDSYVVDGKPVVNVEVVRKGKVPSEIVVVGAHYDSARGTVGADDNASGVAVMIEIARALSRTPPSRRTIRFVAFVNEEPPYFWKESMGSLHYARNCEKRGEDIRVMISLESLGYYRDEPGTQKYPPIVSWLYPNRGDFVAFVGNTSSRSLVREAIGTFRNSAQFPSEGAALPGFVSGVGWSDHWSFWQVGYPALMVTDTATFRNPSYHTPQDTPDTLDYERLARVTNGLLAVVNQLAQ
jgi:hypothetical protein